MDLFLQNVLTAAKQVVILYILVAVGFAADRFHIFSQNTAKASNNLMFYVVTPCVIINSFSTMEFSKNAAKGFAIALLCAFGSHFIGMLTASPFFNKSSNSAVFKFASIYGNVGYMALPLANAVLGSDGVFYASGGVIAHNTIAFTHGVWLMNKGKDVKFNYKSLIINPGVISVIIGLPLFLFSVHLPEVISQPITYIAGLNTPLAMIILGTYIANTDLKSIFRIKEQYLIMVLKLIIMPVVILLALKIAGLKGALVTACVISAAAPSANNTVMFSVKYGKDIGTASKIVALNSFASVLTMPVMIALSKM